MILLVASVALVAAPAAAQDEQGQLPPAFSSDRPGFANSTRVAARGHLTTELGVDVQIDDTTVVDLPNLWFRTGILEWLEARVRVPNAIGLFDGTGATFGVDDPVVGFKIGGAVADTVSISSDWEISLPVGMDGFGASEPELHAEAQLKWTIFGPLSIVPNAVADVRVVEDPTTGELVRYFRGGGSLQVAWQIIDVLTVFVQSVVLGSDRLPLSVMVGGGVAAMVMPIWQIDASFNTGVLEQDMPPTVSAGTTVLF